MGYSKIGRPLYIVDGYNVVFNGNFSNKMGSIEALREELVKYLDNYRSKKNVDIVVVWDGDSRNIDSSSNHDYGRVMNLFSRNPENADSKIVKMVAKNEKRGRIIVVSNDRRHITGVVHNLGAKTINVEGFLSLIGYRKMIKRQSNEKTHENGKDKFGTNDLTVDEWLRIFKSKKEKESDR